MLKVFCYHGNKSTILLFYSIFRTTQEDFSKLYFVEICKVSEKLWLFNHKRADFWFPNFGFKRSLLSFLHVCKRRTIGICCKRKYFARHLYILSRDKTIDLLMILYVARHHFDACDIPFLLTTS